MPRSTSCELCDAKLEFYTEREDGTPATWICRKCYLVQVRLDDAEAALWRTGYRAGGYHERCVLAGFESFEARYEHDLRIARVRMENLIRHVRSGRLLDVGASNGAFVVMAKRYGFEAFGLEPDAGVVAQARELANVRVLPVSLEEAAPFARPRSFTVVTFHDSFEHLLEPHQALDAARGLLRTRGLLVLEMPDADCPAARLEGRDWKHCKPAEHAYLYGRSHVERLLARHHFDMIDTIVPYPDRRTYYARAV